LQVLCRVTSSVWESEAIHASDTREKIAQSRSALFFCALLCLVESLMRR
jgi:hypothetical protein